MDLKKQIEYWRNGSKEDFEVAELLFSSKKYQHALFFAHLAIEKNIKGHITKKTKNIPPKIHQLIKLAELAGLQPDNKMREFLVAFDVFQIQGRYPVLYKSKLTQKETRNLMQFAKKVLEWLDRQYDEI